MVKVNKKFRISLTVAEIKEKLSCAKDGDLVFFQMNSGCCNNDHEILENPEISDYYPPEKGRFAHLQPMGLIVISFDPLPGYKSCREASNTKKNHENYSPWVAQNEFCPNTFKDSVSLSPASEDEKDSVLKEDIEEI